MEKIEFVKYETPHVEVIEVEIEKGFAASDGTNAGGQTGGSTEE